jgi:hypothetical protein
MALIFPFVNNEIFSGGDDDYVICGFFTEKLENFKYADFYSALEDRIKSLIEEYIERTAIIHMEEGHENPKKAALRDCAMVIGDNLKIPVELIDVEGMTNTIMYSPYIQNWLNRVKMNVDDFLKNQPDFTEYQGVYNESIKMSAEQKEHYDSLIQDTSFEMLIESISMVEI